ncbi:hypothetical protein MKW94_007063 [Papaver nudicaule]|uniref:Uncharacterized protein n=1 Tax=Papaver nudicaule TaxID=74823 RepID=A0AA41RM91_PAPNU|nr:hypothetical protein [Papaver nudicaule]
MQPSSRGAPHGIVASPQTTKQRIAYWQLTRFSSSLLIISLWEFLKVNDLVTTEVAGKTIFGFVERKGWFGVTIRMKNGQRVFSSKGKLNGVIINFDHQMMNGKHVNWRFTTLLKVKMDEVGRMEKEIYKIFEEDKDLEQEDAYAFLSDLDFPNNKAVFLVSCFTKSATHEGYFTIRDALLLKLEKLIHATS